MLISTSKKLKKKIKAIGQLPTLPTIFANLQSCLANPNTSAKDIASVIENDQALASKILKTVNSSFYSYPREVDTIWQSTVIIGFQEISNLVLSISIIGNLSKDNNKKGIDSQEYWRHCLATAICTGIIARHIEGEFAPKPEVCFMAGLLHDIGRLIMDQYLDDEYSQIVNHEELGEKAIYELEYDTLGYNHQDVGKVLANIWQLPPNLVDAIAYHHNPEIFKGDKEKFTFLSCVHIADIIVHGLGIGSGLGAMVPPTVRKCWHKCSLSYDQLDDIVRKTLNTYEELAQSLLGDTQT